MKGHVPQKSANYKLVLSTTESIRREIKSKIYIYFFNPERTMLKFYCPPEWQRKDILFYHDASQTRRCVSPAVVGCPRNCKFSKTWRTSSTGAPKVLFFSEEGCRRHQLLSGGRGKQDVGGNTSGTPKKNRLGKTRERRPKVWPKLMRLTERPKLSVSRVLKVNHFRILAHGLGSIYTVHHQL